MNRKKAKKAEAARVAAEKAPAASQAAKTPNPEAKKANTVVKGPTGFARRGNLTDNRAVDDWKSRYADPECRRQIWAEGIYLFVLLVAAFAALVLVWQGTPMGWLDVDATRYANFKVHAYAALSGLIGGTLLSIKWLYHSVGKGRWHTDRLAWRLFTPPLSGAFAFCLIALLTSGVVELFNKEQLETPETVVGLGLLFGYFSDFTVARLYTLAESLLGPRPVDQSAADPPAAPADSTP